MTTPPILQEPHHQTLELLSARALASGDIASAFAFADRRCRIPPLAEPHCFILRADALYRMGERELAVRDIERAIEIAPDEIAPNRRLLAWAERGKRQDAALRLIARDRDPDSLRRALSILREGGQRASASARLVGDTIHGWAAWPRTGSLEIIVADGTNTAAYELQAHPSHPLATVGCAADFALPLLESDSPQLITVSCGGETLVSIRHAGAEAGRQQRGQDDGWPRPGFRSVPEVSATCAATIVVPIYADFAATKACIESLLAQPAALQPPRVILVNDASPDADINHYLASLREDRRIEILVNERNLGFVGAVNRALSEVRHGDILLLNADTIVPPGFVDRLAGVAHSAPQIGTVTPLSNNGEFTSFPVPNTHNPLPSLADIIAIDHVAAKVNADRIVDIPNGIGFCLFVTRACLDAVGFLSNRYDRGYLEDVDFCLRARERRFPGNVCAPSIYVGHAGSRSFGSEKRSLVVRNLAIAERRFPTYRSECAAFVTLDPLRTARQAIERATPSCDGEPLLLVTGDGAVAAVAHERARQIEAHGQRVLVLTFRGTSGGGIAKVTGASGAVPQSMTFEVSVADEVAALMAYLRATMPIRLEIADPAAIPPVLLDKLMALGLPYDILIADAGLLADETAPCRGRRTSVRQPRRTGTARFALRELTAGADHFLAPCGHAEAFATRWRPNGASARLERIYSHTGPKPARDERPSDGLRRRLGIIPIESGLHELQFIRDLAGRFRTKYPERTIVVLGDLPDDVRLMRIGNTLVTGSIGIGELIEAYRTHGVGGLLIGVTRPLFGHPLQSFALSCGMPVAYFDWSGGAHRARHGDLLLDPGAPTDALVDALTAWQGGR